MKQIYTTTLRLNLSNTEDRQAYEHLRQLNKHEYHSVSRAIVTAINDYFERQNRLASDPYLETCEKEDAFLSKIEETITRSLQSCAPVNFGGILQIMQGARPAAVPAPVDTDEDISAALDFADSF